MKNPSLQAPTSATLNPAEIGGPSASWSAYEELGAPSTTSGLLLICDHACSTVPTFVHPNQLGLGEEDLGRHISYDLGARELTLLLACRLGVRALLSTFSRLVIDPNRAEQDPSLILAASDGTRVPANEKLSEIDRANRLNWCYRPYHARLASLIEEIQAVGQAPILLAIHSFTPQMQSSGGQRPWDIGIVWERDERLAKPLLVALRQENEICVGENQPYSGYLKGESLDRHGLAHGHPNALIEVRQDLLLRKEGQEAWADRLERAIRHTVFI